MDMQLPDIDCGLEYSHDPHVHTLAVKNDGVESFCYGDSNE